MTCKKTYSMKHGKGKFQVYDATAVTPKFITFDDVIITMPDFNTPIVSPTWTPVMAQNQILNYKAGDEEIINQDEITITIIIPETSVNATTLTPALREFVLNKKDDTGAALTSTLPASKEFIVLGTDGSDKTSCINDDEFYGLGSAFVLDSLTDTADKDFGLDFAICEPRSCTIDASAEDTTITYTFKPWQRPTEISALPNT